MIQNLKMNQPEHYYKMPLVGITETRARVGMAVSTSYTSRCGDKNCWFVGNAATSAEVQAMLDTHECPTPPARNELPSGYSTVEKLWDEADDVMFAIMQQTGYNAGDRYLDGPALQGYLRGLCFSLSMMTHPYFRTIAEVGRELQKRYRIRIKDMPHEPTPSYRYNPMPVTPPPGEKAAFHGKTVEHKPATKATTASRAAAKKKLSAINMSSLSTTDAENIVKMHTMGMFTEEELAQNYKVTVETIRFLVTQKV